MNNQEILKDHLMQVVHINQVRDLIQKKVMQRIPNFLDDIKNCLMESNFTVNTDEKYIELSIDGAMNSYEMDYIKAAYLFKSGFINVDIFLSSRKRELEDPKTVIRLYYELSKDEAATMKVVQDGIKPAEIGGSTLQSAKEQFMAMTQSPEDYLEEKHNV